MNRKGSFYKEIKCGSYSGYQRHYRLKEPACDACKAGAAEYTSKRYYENHKKSLAKAAINRKKPEYKAKKKRQKARRRARLKGGLAEVYTLEQVFETYGTICYLCEKEIDLNAPRNCNGDNWQMGLHIDHVIPIYKSGNDTLENVRPTHALCNLRRNKERAGHP